MNLIGTSIFQDVADSLTTEFDEVFDNHDPMLYVTLIGEETRELFEAYEAYQDDPTITNLTNVLKEYIDVAYVTSAFMGLQDRARALNEDRATADDLLRVLGYLTIVEDELEVVRGMFSELELILAIREVHRSNMSKLGTNGKPIRRDDGKVLKGPNYSPADLSSIVSRFVAPDPIIIAPASIAAE